MRQHPLPPICYAIGYGRAPRATSFKPGQSGNPSGRRRGAPNVRAEIEAELNELMPLPSGNVQVTVSKARVLVKSIVAAALEGNITAAKHIFELYMKLQPPEGAAPVSEMHENVDAVEFLNLLPLRLRNSMLRYAEFPASPKKK